MNMYMYIEQCSSSKAQYSLRSLNINSNKKNTSRYQKLTVACPNQTHSHGEETLGTFLSERQQAGKPLGMIGSSAMGYERLHGGNMFSCFL